MASEKAWATEGDWKRHRQAISHMYTDAGKTLPEVMAAMEKQHGFYAT